MFNRLSNSRYARLAINSLQGVEERVRRGENDLYRKTSTRKVTIGTEGRILITIRFESQLGRSPSTRKRVSSFCPSSFPNFLSFWGSFYHLLSPFVYFQIIIHVPFSFANLRYLFPRSFISHFPYVLFLSSLLSFLLPFIPDFASFP